MLRTTKRAKTQKSKTQLTIRCRTSSDNIFFFPPSRPTSTVITSTVVVSRAKELTRVKKITHIRKFTKFCEAGVKILH